ncbi:uncharacterized protein BDR25DRAFT_317748 [Lindgomyces ingoldianus]|uniref:Uncharacterized protein n=1 Tax=Lindgomyces ingoldianus TaxID=673940 RepID=A0ACB6QHF1_9PLEO|nr:uncharacterized protein BDR25DRAFT_317748 [Lindgomyces ingoldianus]KAF2466359.1 hypothetical protein BDR25DRAFT_317748 [Lindgomyces ingoldianus]
MKSLLLLLAPLPVLASLNCTLTAPLKINCCPNKASEEVKTYPIGHMIMLGCASDDTTDGRWFWNYNGLYTPTTKDVTGCVLGNRTYPSTDVLPACSKDQFVLDLLKDKHPFPLDACDPKCVTNKNFPNQTWFGDDMPWKE